MQANDRDRSQISLRRYVIAFAVTIVSAQLGSSCANGHESYASPAVVAGIVGQIGFAAPHLQEKGVSLTQADVNLNQARIAYQRSEELHVENLLANAANDQARYNLTRSSTVFNGSEAQANNAKRAL